MREKKAVGRPRAFEEDQALLALMDLFWEKGYEGVSLADIMAATGLKKGSLYATFGDKRQMYLKAIAHYESRFVDTAAQALRASGDPLKRITTFLSAPIEAVWPGNDRRGCFLCNASADQAAHDPETERLVRRGFEKMEAALADAIAETSHGADEDRLRARARHLLAVYAGLRLMARTGMDRQRLRAARDAALADVTGP